jgi:hypothetical protein
MIRSIYLALLMFLGGVYVPPLQFLIVIIEDANKFYVFIYVLFVHFVISQAGSK